MGTETFTWFIAIVSALCSVIMAVVAIRSRAWSHRDASEKLLAEIGSKVDKQSTAMDRMWEALQELKSESRRDHDSLRKEVHNHEQRISTVEGFLKRAS